MSEEPIRPGDPVWIKDASGAWHASVARSPLQLSSGGVLGKRWECYLVDWHSRGPHETVLTRRCNWPVTHVVRRTSDEKPST